MGLNNDDIKALISILQKGLTNDDDDQEEKPSATRTNSRRSVKAKQSKKKNNNKFDIMPEFNMCKEDLDIDRKIKKPPPSIRNRPFDPVKVQCRICGKKEKVAPSILSSTEIERYKCNKCSTGAG